MPTAIAAVVAILGVVVFLSGCGSLPKFLRLKGGSSEYRKLELTVPARPVPAKPSDLPARTSKKAEKPRKIGGESVLPLLSPFLTPAEQQALPWDQGFTLRVETGKAVAPENAKTPATVERTEGGGIKAGSGASHQPPGPAALPTPTEKAYGHLTLIGGVLLAAGVLLGVLRMLGGFVAFLAPLKLLPVSTPIGFVAAGFSLMFVSRFLDVTPPWVFILIGLGVLAAFVVPAVVNNRKLLNTPPPATQPKG